MKIKLIDICSPKQWKTIPTDELLDDGYPVYGANGLIGYSNVYNHKDSVIAITCRGASCGSVNITPPFSYVTGNAMCLDEVKHNIDINYLYYFLKNYNFKNIISGSAQPQITRQGLNKVYVRYYSPTKQKQIVSRLKCISTIIELKKIELNKFDDLIKARFVEMFGTLDDPADEFEKATLKKLCNKITDGKHGGCTSEEGTQRYFVGAREIYDDEVHYDTAPEINVEEFEKDYKRCNIEIGDFLIVNTGATIGKSAIAYDERTEHTLLQKSVALLKIKKDKLNPVFLKWCYRVNTRMYMVQSASAQPNLLLSKINGTVIYVPSIERQNQFADFVQQVDKSREEVKKSLEKTQQLYDSLMQEYFG